MIKPRVHLIHWNAAEAEERASRLEAAGYIVSRDVPAGPRFFQQLGQDPPAAVVIDLERLPSQGRDIGLALRKQGSTRRVPLVYVGGEPAKVAQVRALLPDATYTAWEEIGSALAGAIAHPIEQPVVPGSVFEAYTGRPLAQKLGLKAGTAVALVGAPADFGETLGAVPEGVQLLEGRREGANLTLWFVRSREELGQQIATMAAQMGQSRMWICWPKKGSAVAADLGQPDVRQAGLDAGLVDYKICSIDATWSGLLFRRRSV